DADVAGGADVDGAGRRAGTDAERQARAAGHVANEEVRFVAGHVPSLGGEAAAVVLVEAVRRSVAGLKVEVEDRRAGAKSDEAAAHDPERARLHHGVVEARLGLNAGCRLVVARLARLGQFLPRLGGDARCRAQLPGVGAVGDLGAEILHAERGYRAAGELSA